MKKLRIVLSVLAFTFAISAAYSTKLATPPTVIDGYEFVSGGNPQCVRYQDACQNEGTIDCTIGLSTTVLRDSPTGTCGNNAYKKTI